MYQMDSFQAIYANVIPTIKKVVKQLDSRSMVHNTKDNELNTFLLDFYMSRVDQAIELGHIWMTTSKYGGVKPNQIVLDHLKASLLDKSKDLTRSVYLGLTLTRVDKPDINRYLERSKLLFSSQPADNDLMRIEKNYQSSRIYVSHLITMSRNMTTYIQNHGMIIDKEEFFDQFRHQSIMIDRDEFFNEQMFTLINQLLSTRIDLDILKQNLEFKIVHSEKCNYKDRFLQISRNYYEHSATILVCDNSQRVFHTEENSKIEIQQNTQAIEQMFLPGVYQDVPSTRRVDVTQFIGSKPIDPFDWNKRIESTYLIIDKRCRIETICDQQKEKIDEIKIPGHSNDPVLIWYGVHKTILSLRASLEFAFTKNEALEINMFKRLLESYIKVYEQGADHRAN
jgi:hypothetical protein